MKSIVGISAFGLKDCVAKPGEGIRQAGFYLADAVLPQNAFGHIRTGHEAENERTHAGLNWPPEARVRRGEFLRRVPIPYAWRALVEAGDSTARWNIGQGVSFPVSRILASHVARLASDQIRRVETSPTSNPEEDGSTSVIPVGAIPNNLDEFGQEALLRELATMGLWEAMLIWRPVAAALAWLDGVEGDFPRHMGEHDHIHVVCLGPDTVEFNTFRLRVKEHDNRLYVLPLRDRPRELTHLFGLDWAGQLIEQTLGESADGAFWQAFTTFPEIWECIAGRAWKGNELPRVWSLGDKWGLWDPSNDLYNRVYSVPTGQCRTLQEIHKRSCPLGTWDEETPPDTWGKALQAEVSRMTRLFPDGRLRGMIVCGPLVPQEAPAWLTAEFEALSRRGLEVEGDLAEPEAGRLWIPPDCEDPVAQGASIYGQRTLSGVPSYLDTMPQVSVLAQGQGQYAWIPLLNAQEVLGGEEFRDIITGRFQLDQGRRRLKVYLYKGPLKDAPSHPETPLDPSSLPHEGVSPCLARLIRAIVRQLGSTKRVCQRGFFRSDTSAARYAIAFAEALYNTNVTEQAEHLEVPAEQLAKSPFRRASFDFPSVPDKDVLLDVEVRMRPASGLARVELLPEDPSFLQERKVRLNYSTMRTAARLPRQQRGWPGIQEIVVDPNDNIILDGLHHIVAFERTPPKADSYTSVINDIRDGVLKRTAPYSYAGLEMYVHTIDQDGKACSEDGNRLIQRIADKFYDDFRSLHLNHKTNQMDRVFSRAAWLFAATPINVTAYVKDIIAGDFTKSRWRWAVESASRAFVEVEDFRMLFGYIAHRARTTWDRFEPFPIEAARAVCRVLMFRKDGEKGLTADTAGIFARRALDRLKQEQREGNFRMLFFQLILLLLYLLRYRRSDPSCFDPKNYETIAVFDEAMASMDAARTHFSHRYQYSKARKVESIVDGFQKYLHYEGTEDLLTVLGEFAGDMT